jgi:hypothetical protein
MTDQELLDYRQAYLKVNDSDDARIRMAVDADYLALCRITSITSGLHPFRVVTPFGTVTFDPTFKDETL